MVGVLFFGSSFCGVDGIFFGSTFFSWALNVLHVAAALPLDVGRGSSFVAAAADGFGGNVATPPQSFDDDPKLPGKFIASANSLTS